MKKVGESLETHKLWREMCKLQSEEANKVLSAIVQQRFSIGDATQVVLCAMYILAAISHTYKINKPTCFQS